MNRSCRLPTAETHRIKARLIQQSGNKCNGCGYQFPKDLHRHQLARKDGSFELDHKVPLCRGGTNEWQNLQVLCIPCHDGKTNFKGKSGPIRNMTDYEWRAAGKPQDWSKKKQIMRRRKYP